MARLLLLVLLRRCCCKCSCCRCAAGRGPPEAWPRGCVAAGRAEIILLDYYGPEGEVTGCGCTMAGFGAHSGSSSGGPFTSGTAAGGSAATRIVPLNRDSGIVKSGSEQRPRQARSSCCRAHWQRAAFRGRQRPNTSLQATNAGERSGSEQRERRARSVCFVVWKRKEAAGRRPSRGGHLPRTNRTGQR